MAIKKRGQGIRPAGTTLTDDQLKAELKRIADDELRRLLPELLRELKISFGKNPLAAWHAIYYCTRCGEPLPGWVTDYLGRSARELVKIGEAHRFKATAQRNKLDEKLAAKITLHKIKKKEVPVLVARALGLLPIGAHHVFNRFMHAEKEISAVYEILDSLDDGENPPQTIDEAFVRYAKSKMEKKDSGSEVRAYAQIKKIFYQRHRPWIKTLFMKKSSPTGDTSL